MKVFIGWSGKQSHAIAHALGKLTRRVLPYARPWISDKDIATGDVWFSEIRKQLRRSDVEIVCLTRGNMNAPWIYFEAGAIANKSVSPGQTKGVRAYLIGVDSSEVDGPLHYFHHAHATLEDTIKLLQELHKRSYDSRITRKVIERLTTQHWKIVSEALEKTPIDDGALLPTPTDVALDYLMEKADINSSQRPEALTYTPERAVRTFVRNPPYITREKGPAYRELPSTGEGLHHSREGPATFLGQTPETPRKKK